MEKSVNDLEKTQIFVAYFKILSQHLEDMRKATRSSRTKCFFSGYTKYKSGLLYTRLNLNDISQTNTGFGNSRFQLTDLSFYGIIRSKHGLNCLQQFNGNGCKTTA